MERIRIVEEKRREAWTYFENVAAAAQLTRDDVESADIRNLLTVADDCEYWTSLARKALEEAEEALKAALESEDEDA